MRGAEDMVFTLLEQGIFTKAHFIGEFSMRDLEQYQNNPNRELKSRLRRANRY